MQIKDLIKLLNAHHAEYIIIGAQAVGAHGFVRATKDIDILINPTPENIGHVRSALEAFGYDTTDASVEDFQTKKILFRQYWYDVDIHPNAKGVETEEALQNKLNGLYDDEIPTFYASLEDIIKMKKAAGRPQDLEDLRFLEEIKKQQSKKE